MKSCAWIVPAVLTIATSAGADNWPAWRGPNGNGIANERNIPIDWNGGKNITWKTPLPEPGNGSPIVWEDRIFLASASADGRERSLLCFHRDSGELLWKRSVPYVEEEPTHKTNPYSSGTPATDGQMVFVWHGSAGLAAYDLDGEPMWHTPLGTVRHIWGNGSSPVLFEDTVIMYVGPAAEAKIVALDKRDGSTVWKRPLPETSDPTLGANGNWFGSFSTPLLINNAGRPEMIMPLPGYVTGFNPRTGQEYWRCGGLTPLIYTTAHYNNGIVIVLSGYNGSRIGLKLPGAEGRGDITDTHRLWRHDKISQRIGSGVLFGGYLYTFTEGGVAECLDAATGEQKWESRLDPDGRPAKVWGSFTLAGNRLYVTDTNGTTFVIEPTPVAYRLIAKNRLESNQMTRATSAFSDGQIFIRTYENLYCIGARVKAAF